MSPTEQRRRAWCLATSLESLPQAGKSIDIAKAAVAAAARCLRTTSHGGGRAGPKLVKRVSERCSCSYCQIRPHLSSCAVHNEPAYPEGPCDCGPMFPRMPHDVHRALWTLLNYTGSLSAAGALLAEYALEDQPEEVKESQCGHSID